ncbi:hypothetical protein [Variovorax sp. dw_308]|uniref:hypothetical protein n=1 Tax=Variovorax sp. dw_308 TaxID=2721546 RepID=UPI001C49014E|nr:hypothetical protein [Variovorax sp. dw_308]
METQGRIVTPLSLSIALAKAAFERGQLDNYKPLQSLKASGAPSTPKASWGPMMKR